VDRAEAYPEGAKILFMNHRHKKDSTESEAVMAEGIINGVPFGGVGLEDDIFFVPVHVQETNATIYVAKGNIIEVKRET